MSNISSALEAVLFASGDSVSISRLARILDVEEQTVIKAADSLSEEYISRSSGIRLLRLEQNLQLSTAQEYSDCVAKIIEDLGPAQLSQQALEVLAIVAYFQPVTKVYIDQVRGVDSTYTVNMLCVKGLIEQCGKLDMTGRPLLYKTTEAFLRTAGISSLDELPVLPDMTSSESAEKLRLQIEEIRNEPSSKQLSMNEINSDE